MPLRRRGPNTRENPASRHSSPDGPPRAPRAPDTPRCRLRSNPRGPFRRSLGTPVRARTASDDRDLALALARTVSRNDGARRTIRAGQRVRMRQENALEHFVHRIVAGIDDFPGLHSGALRLFFMLADLGDVTSDASTCRTGTVASRPVPAADLGTVPPRTGSCRRGVCSVRKTPSSREGPSPHAAFPPLARPTCRCAGIAWDRGQWYGLAPVPQRSASATRGPAPVQDRRRRIAEAAIPMDGTLHARS